MLNIQKRYSASKQNVRQLSHQVFQFPYFINYVIKIQDQLSTYHKYELICMEVLRVLYLIYCYCTLQYGLQIELQISIDNLDTDNNTKFEHNRMTIRELANVIRSGDT